MNRWKIPDWLEREIIERDRRCVYCGVVFRHRQRSSKRRPSWEHIINDARIVTRENIARCCVACNASKGTKGLEDWLESKYCRTRGITRDSVASVVKSASRHWMSTPALSTRCWREAAIRSNATRSGIRLRGPGDPRLHAGADVSSRSRRSPSGRREAPARVVEEVRQVLLPARGQSLIHSRGETLDLAVGDCCIVRKVSGSAIATRRESVPGCSRAHTELRSGRRGPRGRTSAASGNPSRP